MVYTKEEDKAQIYKAFKSLLVEFDMSLLAFCEKHNYKYINIYQKFKKTGYNLPHDLVNEMIQKLDPKRSLQTQNRKLVIIKTFN